MSAFCREELDRDLSAARDAVLVDMSDWRATERRIDEATQCVIGLLRAANATVSQVEQAIGYAKIRVHKGDTPRVAAATAVVWALRPPGAA